MDEETFKQKLKDLLDSYGTSNSENGSMCTTYFLVAEYFDAEGDYWAKSFFTEDGIPTWRVTGLVQHAIENDFISEEGDE